MIDPVEAAELILEDAADDLCDDILALEHIAYASDMYARWQAALREGKPHTARAFYKAYESAVNCEGSA